MPASLSRDLHPYLHNWSPICLPKQEGLPSRLHAHGGILPSEQRLAAQARREPGRGGSLQRYIRTVGGASCRREGEADGLQWGRHYRGGRHGGTTSSTLGARIEWPYHAMVWGVLVGSTKIGVATHSAEHLTQLG